MVQQSMFQALFASGRTRQVMDFLQVHENRLDEENERGWQILVGLAVSVRTSKLAIALF